MKLFYFLKSANMINRIVLSPYYMKAGKIRKEFIHKQASLILKSKYNDGSWIVK